jgi:hypothetical protein
MISTSTSDYAVLISARRLRIAFWVPSRFSVGSPSRIVANHDARAAKEVIADRAAFGSFEPVPFRMRALFLDPTGIPVCRPACVANPSRLCMPWPLSFWG